MKRIEIFFKKLKQDYDSGRDPIDEIIKLGAYSLDKLNTEAKIKEQGQVGRKAYNIYTLNGEYSRPFLADAYVHKPLYLEKMWGRIIKSVNTKTRSIDVESIFIDRCLYTSVMSFACCYDLYKRSSRKTPGTYFEVILGSLISKILPNYIRSKHIPIPNVQESVSTDIVFSNSEKRKSLVIPAKITTRERIVQPFAHQRILDSVFGEGYYNSALLCVSEMQRDENDNVKEICVPNTIKLFQNYLAKLSGIYYLDPPIRYMNAELHKIVDISSIGDFLNQKISNLT